MIPRCAIQPDGSISLTLDADAANVLINGVLVNPDGAIRASEDNPDVFVGGLGLKHSGELCVAIGGTVLTYQEGLPVDSSGRLVVQTGNSPGVSDAFVNSVCCNASGVFTIGGVDTTTLWVDADTWDDSEIWGAN